jgi:hypothetical protein
MSKFTKKDRLGVASTVKTPQASLSVTKDSSGPDASAQKALDAWCKKKVLTENKPT